MSTFVAAALLAAAGVIVEIIFPGAPLYHAGWYNVLLCALIVVAAASGRKNFRRIGVARSRLAIVSVIGGTAIAGFAGVVSGLLAPDNQTYIGAPGQRVRVESLGDLVFPIAQTENGSPGFVRLERSSRSTLRIGERFRDTGNFIVRTIARSVVYVEARDLRGNRLTVTQPLGAAFLSPILLMQHRQSIAGLDLPFDSFNVPAARRIVKAVMFTPAQAAMLLHGGAVLGEAAVLFAVDDENEQPLPHAIALSAGARTVRADDLLVRGAVASYPAVEVVAAPNLLATSVGALLVLGGLIALIVNVLQDTTARRRSRARS